jgi:hypothetical protein
MNADHKLRFLLSELQSIFPGDSLLGVPKVPYYVQPNQPQISQTEKQKKDYKEIVNEIRWRLAYKWKAYNKVQYMPKDERKKKELNDRIDNLARTLYGAWKHKRTKLEVLKSMVEDPEKLHDLDKNRAEKERNDLNKMVQNEQKELDKIKKNEDFDTWETQNTKLDELKTKRNIAKQRYNDLTNRKVTRVEDLFSLEYKECYAAYKELRKKMTDKEDTIQKLENGGLNSNIARGDLGYIKEKYYTLKKIRDEFMLSEFERILRERAEKQAKT